MLSPPPRFRTALKYSASLVLISSLNPGGVPFKGGYSCNPLLRALRPGVVRLWFGGLGFLKRRDGFGEGLFSLLSSFATLRLQDLHEIEDQTFRNYIGLLRISEGTCKTSSCYTAALRVNFRPARKSKRERDRETKGEGRERARETR